MIDSDHSKKQDLFWEHWVGPMNHSVRNKRFFWCLEKMKEQKIKTVMDVGCGPGWHTKILFDSGYDVTGSDISIEAIKIARENFPDLKFLEISAEAIDGRFDAIICLAVLSMVEDDDRAVRQLARHAQLGYFSLPTYADHELHLRKYDLESAKRLMEKYGEIINIEIMGDQVMVEIRFYDKTI